jgi:hypothetical protein
VEVVNETATATVIQLMKRPSISVAEKATDQAGTPDKVRIDLLATAIEMHGTATVESESETHDVSEIREEKRLIHTSHLLVPELEKTAQNLHIDLDHAHRPHETAAISSPITPDLLQDAIHPDETTEQDHHLDAGRDLP